MRNIHAKDVAVPLLLLVGCVDEGGLSALEQASTCADGATQSAGACGPGQLGTNVETCVAGAWVKTSCDVPIYEPVLCSVPELVARPGDVVVSPSSHTGWADVLADVTPATRNILLTAGDYTSWGFFDLGPTAPSGVAGDPIVLRYFRPGLPDDHPVDRTDEARIHGILFWGGVHDWVVHGLTIRDPEPGLANGLFHVLGPSQRIILDGNLVDESRASLGIRVRDSQDVCVQRNVVRNNTGDSDSVAIQVKPNQSGVQNVKILANELYNWVDGVQVTNQSSLPVYFTIEGNDIYVTPDTYVTDPTTGLTYSCTENAVDVKAGGPAISRVARNRMWGFRETPPPELWPLCGPNFQSGSAGDAIVLHVDAVNVKVEGNTIGDSVHGLRDSYRAGGRNVELNWNYFYDIPAPDANVRNYGGAVVVVEDDVDVISNRFAWSPLVCPVAPWPPQGWNPAAPLVTGNGFIGPTSVGVCTNGTNWPQSNPYAYRYWRRRLTGPELISLPGYYR